MDAGGINSIMLSIAGLAGPAPVFIKGFIHVSTVGGTLTLKAFASSTTGAITILRGSYLRVWKIL
jgi:hypothetical protein